MFVSDLDDKFSCPAVKAEHRQASVGPVEGEAGVDEQSRARSCRHDRPLKPLRHLPGGERSHPVLRGEDLTVRPAQHFSVKDRPG